jgi:predicted dehydrogenase
VLLRFGGGARGAFHVSQVTAGRKNRLTIEIAATEGAISWDSESPNRLWIGSRQAPNQVAERDPALLSRAAAAISDYPGGHAEGFPDTFKQLFRDVYGWIVATRDGGRETQMFPSFADGDRELRLCEAIAQSATAETWVPVTEYGSKPTTDAR